MLKLGRTRSLTLAKYEAAFLLHLCRNQDVRRGGEEEGGEEELDGDVAYPEKSRQKM